MKVLVAVASKHGSTREIAEAVAEEMRAANLEVDLANAADIRDIAGYDAVVFGNAIYMGNWLPEAKKFAERFQDDLAKLPVWLFSSGPLGTDESRPLDDLGTLAAPLGDVPVRDHEMFVGKLDEADLGFMERMAIKMVKAPYGDFRDWERIRDWAREVAGEISALGATARSF